MDRFPKAISIYGRDKTQDIFLERVVVKSKEELESLRNLHYKLDHVLKEEKIKWSEIDANFLEKAYRIIPKWIITLFKWVLGLLGLKEIKDILEPILNH